MRKTMRKQRKARGKQVKKIYYDSHQQVAHEFESSTDRAGTRIDSEHDQWDFIPGYLMQDGKAQNTIGTVLEKDLCVIDTDQGPRIKAAINLIK